MGVAERRSESHCARLVIVSQGEGVMRSGGGGGLVKMVAALKLKENKFIEITMKGARRRLECR